MATIKIRTANKEYEVEGNFSFNAKKEVLKNDEEVIVIRGELVTHKYIDDIREIESHRYILKNIEVIQEVYGSNDFNIFYSFIAGYYSVKGGVTNLSEEQIKKIQDELYKNETSLEWDLDWEGDDSNWN